MAFLNEKILINFILASDKDYVTFEELRYFEKYYQQQSNLFLNYQEIIQNINNICNYSYLQNYVDGIFIKDVTKNQELNKFKLNDEKIINQINNYLNFLRTITRYVVFLSKILLMLLVI